MFLHNVLTLLRSVIASIIYRSGDIVAKLLLLLTGIALTVIASIHCRFFLLFICFSTSPNALISFYAEYAYNTGNIYTLN
jgi:hypothetical protein